MSPRRRASDRAGYGGDRDDSSGPRQDRDFGPQRDFGPSRDFGGGSRPRPRFEPPWGTPKNAKPGKPKRK